MNTKYLLATVFIAIISFTACAQLCVQFDDTSSAPERFGELYERPFYFFGESKTLPKYDEFYHEKLKKAKIKKVTRIKNTYGLETDIRCYLYDDSGFIQEDRRYKLILRKSHKYDTSNFCIWNYLYSDNRRIIYAEEQSYNKKITHDNMINHFRVFFYFNSSQKIDSLKRLDLTRNDKIIKNIASYDNANRVISVSYYIADGTNRPLSGPIFIEKYRYEIDTSRSFFLKELSSKIGSYKIYKILFPDLSGSAARAYVTYDELANTQTKTIITPNIQFVMKEYGEKRHKELECRYWSKEFWGSLTHIEVESKKQVAPLNLITDGELSVNKKKITFTTSIKQDSNITFESISGKIEEELPTNYGNCFKNKIHFNYCINYLYAR